MRTQVCCLLIHFLIEGYRDSSNNELESNSCDGEGPVPPKWMTRGEKAKHFLLHLFPRPGLTHTTQVKVASWFLGTQHFLHEEGLLRGWNDTSKGKHGVPEIDVWTMLEILADSETLPCNTGKGQQRKTRAASYPDPSCGWASQGEGTLGSLCPGNKKGRAFARCSGILGQLDSLVEMRVLAKDSDGRQSRTLSCQRVQKSLDGAWTPYWSATLQS